MLFRFRRRFIFKRDQTPALSQGAVEVALCDLTRQSHADLDERGRRTSSQQPIQQLQDLVLMRE